MGREIKRVALDFEWPPNQIWKGYWNPYSGLKCSTCDGSGMAPEYKILSDGWYNINWCYEITQDEVQALWDDGRLRDFENKNNEVPTAAEVNAWARTNGMGHDAINKYICVDQRAKRLGITEKKCKWCGEDGELWPSEEIKTLAENFKHIEPPEGEGYQMWETTSEGSPQSPVCETPEELAHWLTDNKASVFGYDTTTYENWLAFCKGPGWAPDLIVNIPGKIQSGVDAMAEKDRAVKLGDMP